MVLRLRLEEVSMALAMVSEPGETRRLRMKAG